MRSRLLLGALALVVTAGCNSGTAARQTVNLADRIRVASEAGVEAGTSKVFLKIDMPDGSISADGAYDYKALKGRMTFDFGDSFGGMLQTMEMVQDGKVVYMHMPALAAQAGGKPWFKLDLDKLGASEGGLGSLEQLQNSDPSSALAFLKGVADDVREEGKEQVRGTETTRYAITVDLNKAAASAGPDAKAGVEAMIKELGTSTIPMKVWVDAEDRLRRMVYSMDMAKLDEGATGTMTMTLELYEFGTKVDVAVPPANQVTDAGALLGGGAGAGDASYGS